MRKLVALGILLLGAIPLAMAQSDGATASVDAVFTKNNGIDQNLGKIVPLSTEFTDENGKKVLLRDYVKDKPVIIMPVFFTCKTACNEVFNGVLGVVKDFKKAELGKDYEVISLSIKPTETTADAKLRKTQIVDITNGLRRPGAEQGWHLLTGDLASIHKVTDALGFRYQYDPKTDRINHPTGIMILTPDGVISRYFYGNIYVPKLVLDALNDARAKRVGPEAEKVLFGCMEYDPVNGHYKLVAMRALVVGCYLTAGILALSVCYMSVKYRYTSIPKPQKGGGTATPR